MDRLQQRLTIQEFPPTILGAAAQRVAEQCSFALYDSPCALHLKGDLEVLIREFPFGTLTSEIIAAVSCKDPHPAPCDPLYVKADELLVSEAALMSWKGFRELLGKVKLIYLPSQLSELVRYNSDFDSSDEHVDYGDDKASKIDTSLYVCEPLFEAVLFTLSDGTEEDEECDRFERSFIAQRRRLQPARVLFESGGTPITTLAGVYSNGH